MSTDVPVDMRKCVHRVGRTRAGKTGEAWTLVEEQEVCLSGLSHEVSPHFRI
jgi:ATP-dependent RNA helicase DDX51/DBP6